MREIPQQKHTFEICFPIKFCCCVVDKIVLSQQVILLGIMGEVPTIPCYF